MKVSKYSGVPDELKNDFCDKEDQELHRIDPRTFNKNQ